MKASHLKRGRWLPSMPAAPIIQADPEIQAQDQRLRDSGYKRRDSIRPYLAKNGLITLRFVWRKRSAGQSVTIQHTMRLSLSEVFANDD